MMGKTLLCLGLAVVAALPAWGQIVEPELAEEVVIRRTQYGVPHILAENERAAGFGMGYCQAEDHLLNIMRSILRARGEQAEHFPSERAIEEDFWNRQLRVHARAVETYHRLDGDWRDMLEGFAAGFNHYIALHRDDLPEWVDLVSGHDLAAHGLTGVARFAFNRGGKVQDFIERLEEGEEAIVEPEESMGSNFWSFAPSRTKSGNAVLMGNPHQPWNQVATYYEAHITVPGEYNFYGTTFVGRPVLTTGFNEHLGWTHTVNYPDLEEIYALDLDPDRSDHYLFDGGSIPMRSETHTIKIKTDSGFREETRTFWHTPLGPVVHRTDDQVFVLKSVAYDEFRFYQQWYRLGQSKNFEEFQEALDIMAIPMFNLAYADKDGNIYYLWNGTIPDIPHPNQDDKAVHATKTAEIWTRVHPLDELPQWFNPKGGYIFNSNSAPYLTNLYEPADRGDFPDHFPDNRLSLRSQHSLHLIHNDKTFSLKDVVDMKFSMKALLADRVKDDLVAALNDAEIGPGPRKAAERVAAWDNTVSRDSRGSVLFKTWWEFYSDDHSAGENFAVQWSEDDPISTPRGLADPERAVESFLAAIADLNTRYGTWDVAWGDVHRIRFGDVDLPIGGDGGALGCFRIIGYREADDGKMVARTGDSGVMAVEFGETPKAYTIVAYSQSGNEDSPHYNDQAALFANNEMKRAAFTEEEIEAQLIRRYRPGEEAADRDTGGR